MIGMANCRLAATVGMLLIGLAGPVHAQGDVPPPSPYALPVPGFQGDPDEDEPIRPWRHWGDNRNQGGFVKSLIAPDPVIAVPLPEDRRRLRFCRRHPDQCD